MKVGQIRGANSTLMGGGDNNYGTLFSITPAGALTTLHKFHNDDAPLSGHQRPEAVDPAAFGYRPRRPDHRHAERAILGLRECEDATGKRARPGLFCSKTSDFRNNSPRANLALPSALDGFCGQKALAESHLTRRLFGAMVGRIAALPTPAG